MPTDQTDVAATIAAGNYWRAKEILQGRLAGAGYDCELFRNYGFVLQRMGDLRIAGKYLFLSGHREREYHESIETFKRLDCKGSFSEFWSGMPKAAQNSATSDVPKQVLDELIGLGFQRGEIDAVLAANEAKLVKRKRREESTSNDVAGTDWAKYAIVGILLLLLVGLLFQAVVGVIAIAGILLKFLA